MTALTTVPIILGSVVNIIATKTDYDRQVKAVQKLKDGGMDHGRVKMESNRKLEINLGDYGFKYKQQHKGEYIW